jgi:hypothetical protein
MFVAGVSTRTKIVLAFAFPLSGVGIHLPGDPPLRARNAASPLRGGEERPGGTAHPHGRLPLSAGPLPDRRQTLDAAVMGFFLFFGAMVAWHGPNRPSPPAWPRSF